MNKVKRAYLRWRAASDELREHEEDEEIIPFDMKNEERELTCPEPPADRVYRV